MAARWEYLIVRWHYQRLNPANPLEETAEWAHKHIIEIRWPRTDKPEVVSTDLWVWRRGESVARQTQKARIDIPGLFDELGADGWECFSAQTLGSYISPRDGIETASWPQDVNYHFKRQRDA